MRAGIACRRHCIDDHLAIAIHHQLLRLDADRRFQHRNQRQVLGLIAVAVPGSRADFKRASIGTPEQAADTDATGIRMRGTIEPGQPGAGVR